MQQVDRQLAWVETLTVLQVTLHLYRIHQSICHIRGPIILAMVINRFSMDAPIDIYRRVRGILIFILLDLLVRNCSYGKSKDSTC